MRAGKDAFSVLFAIGAGLGCVGCFGLPGRSLTPPPVVRVPSGTLPSAKPRPPKPTGPIVLADPTPAKPEPAPLPPSVRTTQPPPVTPTSTGPEVPSPPTSTPPADPLAEVRRVQRTAAERFARVDSFIARLRRREQVNGKTGPEETLSFAFRKQPFSIHFKWLSDPGKGREVVYVKGQHDDKIHTLTAAGDIPLMRGGVRIALAPDDPKVLARSRHPISEAGLGAIIDRLGLVLAAMDRNDRRQGTLAYLGAQTRPEYPMPLEGIELLLPPGVEQALPRGGRRLMYFDPNTGLPVIVITYDDKGQEAEYYCFDRLLLNVKLDDDDFNPAKLWRKPPAAGDAGAKPTNSR